MQIMKINETLAHKLIQDQFPEWASLPIKAVANCGWDNRTFHLGPQMLIRIPSGEEYAPQIMKEYEWLPKLSEQLSFQITTPIALGNPSSIYPWHWCINHWLEGETVSKHTIHNMNQLAQDLGRFLKEFQAIDSAGGPLPGPHNFHRGGLLHAYDHEMQIALPKIEDIECRQLGTALWEEALSSQWENKPVWVHGDVAVGNILVHHGHLEAIIDFGQLAIGDPACDLVIAWNFFSGENREQFKQVLELDKKTWIRALGWAFWKTLCWPVKGTDPKQVLDEIYSDYQLLA